MDNSYHAEYNLKRYHARRAEYIEILGGKCVVCGTTENLQFDHIDPSTKTIDIGKLLNVSKAKSLAELKLCQLLCKTHHIEKGQREGDQGQVPHGGGMTGKKNCRCELCAPLKAEWQRNYRKTRKK